MATYNLEKSIPKIYLTISFPSHQMSLIRTIGCNLYVTWNTARPSIGGQKGGTTAAGDRTLLEIKASYHLSLGEQSNHMQKFSTLVTQFIGIRRRKSPN